MSLTKKIFPAHLLNGGNSICIEVKHDWIKAEDVSHVLQFANTFAADAHNAWNACGSVRLAFSGYCSDPLELWEIPEVRAFVKKMIRAWPEWMFFLNTTDETLRVCFMCLVQMERTADANIHRVVGVPVDVLTHGFDGLNQLCAKYQFSEEIVEIVSRRVANCIGLHPISDCIDIDCENQVMGGAG